MSGFCLAQSTGTTDQLELRGASVLRVRDLLRQSGLTLRLGEADEGFKIFAVLDEAKAVLVCAASVGLLGDDRKPKSPIGGVPRCSSMRGTRFFKSFLSL